jgi:hypothetical protein
MVRWLFVRPVPKFGLVLIVWRVRPRASLWTRYERTLGQCVAHSVRWTPSANRGTRCGISSRRHPSHTYGRNRCHSQQRDLYFHYGTLAVAWPKHDTEKLCLEVPSVCVREEKKTIRDDTGVENIFSATRRSGNLVFLPVKKVIATYVVFC